MVAMVSLQLGPRLDASLIYVSLALKIVRFKIIKLLSLSHFATDTIL